MTAIVNAPTANQADDIAARAAAAIADALTQRDFDVCEPVQPASRFLQVTNVRGARCELTLYDSGRLDWEYLHHRGDRPDPRVLAAMTLHLLGGDATTARYAPVTQNLTLKGQVGRAAHWQGMQVRLNLLDMDDLLFEVYAEIAITNPALPDRGTVRVADDGLICWHCQIRHPGHPDDGLDIGDITTALARTLTTAHDANLAL